MIFSILRKLYNENSKNHLPLPFCTIGNEINYWSGFQLYWNTMTSTRHRNAGMTTAHRLLQQPTQCCVLSFCSQDSSFCNHRVVILIQHLLLELCKGSLIFLSILCSTKSWGNMIGGRQRATTNPKATRPIKFDFFGEKQNKPLSILEVNGCNEELLTQA